jgi:hypothetical protein
MWSVHAPAEAVARGRGEDLILLCVVEVLDVEPALLLPERRLRQRALAVGLERPEEQDGLPVTRPGVAPPKHVPPTSSLSNAVDALTIVNGPEQQKEIETWRTVFGIR